MINVRIEMVQWKKQFEEKKEEIKKMPRKTWEKEREYLGEERKGQKEGFGLWFILGGENMGCRYEGEFKNDKYHGKGVYYWLSGRRFEGNLKDGKKRLLGLKIIKGMS